MAGFTRIITLLYAAAHLSSASPVLRSALVVWLGQNVSLSCNLTSSNDITWFLLRSDQLLPLLTVTFDTIGGHALDYHTRADRRKGTVRNGVVDLMILQVEEEDTGLYFCLGRRDGNVHVNRAIHLDVHGVGGGSAGLPCWSLGICVLPALLVSFLVFILGLVLCSGKPAVGCCRIKSPPVTEDVSLHYSSLRHAEKPRHTCHGGRTGLVKAEVTYSTVAECKNKNRSHLR
ncbi:uncharacterized protein LOC121523884 [Cheilinus undulatus]|uniref:uncharacterized protein LOC121523884 n=1 Tax=Cheilinus undulatus TaxID=241271 RepID=UPI001BD59CC6|nr:uncharacterized protein LOC121523884 [Cheilinus undulatus]